MMMAARPGLVHRVGALAFTIGVAAAGWLAIGEPVRQHLEDLREQIATQRTTIGALQAAAQHDAAAGTAALDAAVAVRAQAFLPGETEAIRSANLQALVGGAGAALGLRFASVRALPPVTREHLDLVGVRVEFAAPLDQAQRLLHHLEGLRPELLVESADFVTAPPAPGATAILPIVDISLNVYGAVPGGKERSSP
jgi:hypothetical protein